MNFLPKKRLFLLFLLTNTFRLFSIDNSHFYKPPYFHATKSWETKNWLAVFDAHYAYGSTNHSRDNRGHQAEAFDLYGNQNILYLTANVPRPTNLSAALTGYIDALETTRAAFTAANPADKQLFGQVGFSGKFDVSEFVLNYRQNLIYNFFTELNVPIRTIKSGRRTLCDRTPVGSGSDQNYTQQDVSWTNFRNNLPDILRAYGLDQYTRRSKSTNLGDTALLLGRQGRIPSLVNLFEYFDLAIKAGILAPTGTNRKYQQPFSIETGYNGHWGFPVRVDAIFGLSKDMYIGTYLGLLFFSSRTLDSFPARTHESQNGFIKLYRTTIHEKKGTIFDVGSYLKLDHFIKGLSMLLGYSYSHQSRDSVSIPKGCDYTHTNNVIINNDCRLKNWRMHVIHALAEYDFGVHDICKKRLWQPRISIFYDYPFSGKRVMMSSLVGGGVGCDVTWGF
ncbi:hypothetical protein KKA53_01785 [Candidatus Dependentiae bacterium]|nr:hypothetical protein [Candidatus Dependentiae bacterium]